MAMRHCGFLLALIVSWCGLAAQQCPWAGYYIQPDSSATISLLVATPGVEIYELEGHAGLRVKSAEQDVTLNWGLFDFAAPNFVYRFVKGETDYMCGPMPTRSFLGMYSDQGRGVYELILNLTPREKIELIHRLNDNLQPENIVYRYNYVKDNCSTRPVRMIEDAVGDTIVMSVPSQFVSDGHVSYRDVMRFYHKYYPWYQFGIDLALGDGIDYPVSRRDLAFAPVLLPELLKESTIAHRPLVSDNMHILVEPRPWDARPTPFLLTPLAVGIYVLLLSIGFTVRDLRRKSTTRLFDALMFLVIGLLGCLLTFLIFESTHEATSPNWLIMWLNPLALIVTVFVWLKNGIRVVYCYHFLNFVALLLLSCAWPFLKQEGNIAFIPLIAADALRSVCYMIVNRCALSKVDIRPE